MLFSFKRKKADFQAFQFDKVRLEYPTNETASLNLKSFQQKTNSERTNHHVLRKQEEPIGECFYLMRLNLMYSNFLRSPWNLTDIPNKNPEADSEKPHSATCYFTFKSRCKRDKSNSKWQPIPKRKRHI